MSVLAARAWRTNADMIADVVALGYIRPDDKVIDFTFGRGKWWDRYDPPYLTAILGLDPDIPEMDNEVFTFGTKRLARADFRSVPFKDDEFDVVTFDPPYVSMGGRATSGLTDFMDRYGLKGAAASPRGLHEYNVEGLKEAARVCRPGGFVMTKVAGYISSGRYQPADLWIAADAAEIGLTIHDRLIHVGHLRAQPGGRRQVHARNNYSVLWVFKKPRTRRRPK